MPFKSTVSHNTLVGFLEEAQTTMNKSDAEMAEALGFSRTSIYQAIRKGQMKMPIGKVPVLARTLGASLSEVLTIMLRDMSPELHEVIRKVWVDVSPQERKLIEAYRALAQDRDVAPLVMDGRNVIALITV